LSTRTQGRALPGFSGNQELIARRVARIERDVEQRALTGIQLGVEQLPALLGVVPEFGHPMIDELALLEVGGEAAAGARRDSLAAQHRHVQQAEMPAVADQALSHRTR
jgi:hypothetical protein